MSIKEIQDRFSTSSNKEHWKKLKMLLCSKNKEDIVMGMTLLEDLDEKIYYDGICTFFSLDKNGKWMFREDLEYLNADDVKCRNYLGGSWYYSDECTITFRSGNFPSQYFKNVGVRFLRYCSSKP